MCRPGLHAATNPPLPSSTSTVPQPFKGLSATILRESLYATGYLAIAPILREALSQQPAVQVCRQRACAAMPVGLPCRRGCCNANWRARLSRMGCPHLNPLQVAGHTGRSIRAERPDCGPDCHRVVAAGRHDQDAHAGGASYGLAWRLRARQRCMHAHQHACKAPAVCSAVLLHIPVLFGCRLACMSLSHHKAVAFVCGRPSPAPRHAPLTLLPATGHPAPQAFPDSKAHPEYRSFMSTTRHILATEGAGTFLAGLGPRAFRVCCAGGRLGRLGCWRGLGCQRQATAGEFGVTGEVASLLAVLQDAAAAESRRA